MRVLGPFLGMLASAVTIFCALVRLAWAKPTTRPTGDQWGTVETLPPKAPSWLATFAKWWLIIVGIGATVIILLVVIFTLVSLTV